jgi:hypothetical protein
MSTSSCLLREHRPRQAEGLPRRDVLGAAGSRLRRSTCSTAHCWPCTRRSRGEQNRPRVYRRRGRWFRRLPYVGSPPSRLCEQANVGTVGRRVEAERRLHHHGRTLCAARQQTDTRRDSQLLRPFGSRDKGPRPCTGGGRTGKSRLRFLRAVAERSRPPGGTSAPFWSRPHVPVG